MNQDIIIGQISEALNDKAGRDLYNVSPTSGGLNQNGIRTVVETFINGTEWYRIWSDGWVEQGGKTQKSTTKQTVTFLKPFSDANYTLCLTSNNTVSAYKISYENKMVTGFTENQYQGQYGCEWYACGQSAS